MPDERLALLRDLERADEASAAELAELDELYTEVEELRGRAHELQEFLAGLPDARDAAAGNAAAAEQRLSEARAALEEAVGELARAEAEADAERLPQARRFELRARDALLIAERRAAAARDHAAELETRAKAAERETAALEERARKLAEALLARPRLTGEAVARPQPGASGVAEWGTRARAALLVARSQLAAERDAVVRQANELGAVVLGEELPPQGAAAVARRVERQLGDR